MGEIFVWVAQAVVAGVLMAGIMLFANRRG